MYCISFIPHMSTPGGITSSSFVDGELELERLPAWLKVTQGVAGMAGIETQH